MTRNNAVKLDLSHMSPDELQFIRLYCSLLRKQYYEVKAVMAMMSPAGLAVRSPVVAADAANRLAAFSRDFDAALEKIKQQHRIKEKRVIQDEAQFLNEMADVFALSFFKVVAVDSEMAEQVTIVKDGWCSGEPSSWTKYVDLSETPTTDYHKNIVSHILNFFSAITAWKNPSLYYKKLETDEERDEYDEDDEDDNWYDENN